MGGLYDVTTKAGDVGRWVGAEAHQANAHGHDHSRHDTAVEAHCLVYEQPINWRYFSPNLASLVSRHAEKLLRVKGLLNVDGEPAPVVVHGVQHQFQRLRLASWPDEDRRSKLVLITRGLERDFLADWLRDDRLS
jgi:G3E family GTPase